MSDATRGACVPLSAEAAALIEADRRTAGPPPAQRRQIWRQTARTLAVGGAVAPTAAGGKSLLGLKVAGKAALAKAGGALGAGGAAAGAASATAAAGVKIALVVAISAAAVGGTTLAISHRRAPAIASAQERVTARPARPAPPTAAPRSIVRAAPAPPVAAAVATEGPPAAPPPVATEAPAHAPATASATVSRSAARERRLLDQALSALGRRDLPAARALLAQHAAAFPAGRLVEEREALRVSVYAAGGDGDGAARQAARFRARFPNSVFRISIDGAATPAPR